MNNALVAVAVIVFGAVAIVLLWRYVIIGTPPPPPLSDREEKLARDRGGKAAADAGTRDPQEVVAVVAEQAELVTRGELGQDVYLAWLKGFQFGLHAQLLGLAAERLPPAEHEQRKARLEALMNHMSQVGQAAHAKVAGARR